MTARRCTVALLVMVVAVEVSLAHAAEPPKWDATTTTKNAAPKARKSVVEPATPDAAKSLRGTLGPSTGGTAAGAPAGDDAAYMAFDQGQYLTALRLAEERAKQGVPSAYTLVGRIYAEGLGVGRDEKVAAGWYQRGSELGDVNASFALGVFYAEGKGVPKDRAKSAELFEKAAMTGHPQANYNLGMLFLKGDGKPENPYRAAQHIGYAAAKGIAQAQYDFGVMHQNGVGLPNDAVEASKWIGKAAEQGLAAAQYDYAVMLLRGLGLTKDEPKALGYMQAAAEKGVPGAQSRLAYIYRDGIDKLGVAKNLVEAAKWRIVARAGGVEDPAMDGLVGKLSKADRQAAEKAAAEWLDRSAMSLGQ